MVGRTMTDFDMVEAVDAMMETIRDQEAYREGRTIEAIDFLRQLSIEIDVEIEMLADTLS